MHPLLAKILEETETRYLLSDNNLTDASVEILLESSPIPVSLVNDSFVGIGEPRLLHAARIYLHPSKFIPVLDYSQLDTEDLENVIWARNTLHHLYSANHPRDHALNAEITRSAMPKALREEWCPGLKNKSQFAQIIGVERHSLSCRSGKINQDMREKTSQENPLDRIRRGVRND